MYGHYFKTKSGMASLCVNAWENKTTIFSSPTFYIKFLPRIVNWTMLAEVQVTDKILGFLFVTVHM